MTDMEFTEMDLSIQKCILWYIEVSFIQQVKQCFTKKQKRVTLIPHKIFFNVSVSSQ